MPRVTENDCWIAAQKSSSAAASAGERCSTAFAAAFTFSKSEPTAADDIAISPRPLPAEERNFRRSISIRLLRAILLVDHPDLNFARQAILLA